MKRFLYACLMLTLFACQKENKIDVITVENGPVYKVCKVASIQEFPAADGKNVQRTFTYDADNRVVKVDIQTGTDAVLTKTIAYNSDNKIEKISYSNGNYELFTYAGGVVSSWEVFNDNTRPLSKSVLTYDNSKLVREDKFEYNRNTKTHDLKSYLVYEWDAAGNITSVKNYKATNELRSTDTYSYYSEYVNKQQTITPQLELLFLNWSNDITAFLYSKNLLRSIEKKKRDVIYTLNASGWVTEINSDKKDNLFTFTYGCND